MTSSLTVPGATPSPLTLDDRGLSDEVELARAGLNTDGLGEVILDYGDDFQELGLRP